MYARLHGFVFKAHQNVIQSTADIFNIMWSELLIVFQVWNHQPKYWLWIYKWINIFHVQCALCTVCVCLCSSLSLPSILTKLPIFVSLRLDWMFCTHNCEMAQRNCLGAFPRPLEFRDISVFVQLVTVAAYLLNSIIANTLRIYHVNESQFKSLKAMRWHCGYNTCRAKRSFPPPKFLFYYF